MKAILIAALSLLSSSAALPTSGGLSSRDESTAPHINWYADAYCQSYVGQSNIPGDNVEGQFTAPPEAYAGLGVGIIQGENGSPGYNLLFKNASDPNSHVYAGEGACVRGHILQAFWAQQPHPVNA